MKLKKLLVCSALILSALPCRAQLNLPEPEEKFESAQRAEKDGLYAKAAREYAEAWQAEPQRTEFGFRAAEIWSTRLNNPADAGRILNAILAQSADEEVKQKARGLLQPLQGALQKVYDEKVRAGTSALTQGQTDEALKLFNEAAAYKAESSELHLLRARVYAKRNEVPNVIKELTAVLKAGVMKPLQIFAQPEFAGILANADFMAWVNDALGEEAVKQVHDVVEMAAQMAAPRQTKINPKDGAEMIFIPAGNFIMGSDNGATDEKPQHTVYLDGYWIYKTAVTVGQYKKFCAATGNKMPGAPPWGWIDTHPMVNVSWDDAKAYCGWAGVSLPTEAQWEKAARGIDGREYPWGNDFDKSRLQASSAKYGDANSTAAVGSFPSGASPWGALDMAGNVWEWCSDWYDENYYKSAPNKNPTGPLSGQARVLRGGSWYFNYPYFFRASFRYWLTPADWFNLNGFRCASGR
jgi:formylglycine-generating enzyme required for sulfatase activity